MCHPTHFVTHSEDTPHRHLLFFAQFLNFNNHGYGHEKQHISECYRLKSNYEWDV